MSRLVFNVMLNVLVSQRWLFAGVRPAADYLISRTTPVVPGVRVEPVSAPVRGEWVWAPEADDGVGAILVLHGSGYLICSSRTHRGFASHLSRYSGMPTFAIDYRLAPEHPFPAAEDDAFAAYRWRLHRATIRRSLSWPGTRPAGTWRSRCLAAAQRRAARSGSARAVRPADRSGIPGLHCRRAYPATAARSARRCARGRAVCR